MPANNLIKLNTALITQSVHSQINCTNVLRNKNSTVIWVIQNKNVICDLLIYPAFYSCFVYLFKIRIVSDILLIYSEWTLFFVFRFVHIFRIRTSSDYLNINSFFWLTCIFDKLFHIHFSVKEQAYRGVNLTERNQWYELEATLSIINCLCSGTHYTYFSSIWLIWVLK